MNKTEFTEGKLSCREGPKLETYSCIQIGHCEAPIAMATSSSSTVPFNANASEETVEHAIVAKLARFYESVVSDWSTASTWSQKGQSPSNTARGVVKSFPQLNGWTQLRGRHGKSAFKSILSIEKFESAPDRSMMPSLGSALPRRYSPAGSMMSARRTVS